jgi:hypothetical protein
LSFPDSVVEAKNKLLADDMRLIGAIHIPWAPPSNCHDPPKVIGKEIIAARAQHVKLLTLEQNCSPGLRESRTMYS